MAGNGRNSELTVGFLTSFSRLKRYMDGSEPSTLGFAASQDESIADAASQLGWSALWLEVAIDRVKAKTVKPVDPAFIAAFRDYEENWKESVSTEMWRGLGLDDAIDGSPPLPRHANSNQTSAEYNWQLEDSQAAAITNNFETAIGRAVLEAEEDESLPEAFRDSMIEAGATWDQLKTGQEIDIQGMLRRRQLLPVTFVSQKFVDQARPELLENFTEARNAFIGGAPKAALSMLRSVLEIGLRDFLPKVGQYPDLSALINAADKFLVLPKNANRTLLHFIRSEANSALHGSDSNGFSALKSKSRSAEIEIELVRLFKVIRALVERLGDPKCGR
jgi:hypothetical protein